MASRYLDVAPAADKVTFPAVAWHMFALMRRNLATDAFVFVDPGAAGTVSAAGATLASPTYPDPPVPAGQGGPQDYLFNWVRDAAIAALELAAPSVPLDDAQRAQHLSAYVRLAQTCQSNPPTDDTHWDNFARGCFTLEGKPRDWSNQADGPALQSLALLQAYRWIDDATRAVARELIAANLSFLLGEIPAGSPPSYQRPTNSLWEEEEGSSFFARAVQLRCFQQLKANTVGIPAPAGVDDAITWLTGALARHWSAELGWYLSFEPPWTPDPNSNHDPYDPNTDVVLAALYGTIPAEDDTHPFLDPKLLASASAIRATWTDSESTRYPVNATDAERGYGPLLGRYPSDYYDGDTNDPRTPGHPWSLCTSAVAELYYRVADDVAATSTVPSDSLATAFLTQAGSRSTDAPDSVAGALCKAGDGMLRGLIFHSDDLQLGEQFDRETGFERSLANLTWSYASFLSAVRARPAWAPPL